MILDLSPPKLELVPLLRRAMSEGFAVSALAARIADDGEYLDALLKPALKSQLPTGDIIDRVPEKLFWLHDGQTLLGRLNIRVTLNDYTARQGGHLGYEVHPLHVNKGYGTLLLRHGLQFLNENASLPRALVTIDDDNAPSIRVVEKCGAVLQDVIPHPAYPDRLHRRYWIDT